MEIYSRTLGMHRRGHQLASFFLDATLNGMFIVSQESMTVTVHCLHFGKILVSFCAK